MSTEHRDQMQRLARFREEKARIARSSAATPTTEATTAEATATQEATTPEIPDGAEGGDTDPDVASSSSVVRLDILKDPLIYPGLYAPSGIDMLKILVQVRTRPEPKIDLGAIDSSCALLLCDVRAPDMPIVYCSEPFEALTGYTADEVRGKNCRFLQSPDGNVIQGAERRHTDNRTVFELKNMIAAREEAQITIRNYRKDGTPFTNILTTIPLRWDDNEVQFIVGFQADHNECYIKSK